MCGICISKIGYNSSKINIQNYLNKINSSIKKLDLKKALEQLRYFKCNYCFIEIIQNKNSSLKQQLSFLTSNIKKINFKDQYRAELANDIIWLVESEIIFKCKKIKSFLIKNKIDINKKSIIFTRYLLYSFESINYLESRGRDSFGVSINIISSKKIYLLKNKFKNELKFSSFHKKISSKRYFLNFNFKYAKRIGYSGENTDKILEQIYKSNILKYLSFNHILNTDIIAHTRWASVGEVNLSNTHPVIDKNSNNINVSIMNGDINNYKKINNDLKNNKNLIFSDKKCTNDLKPVSSLIFKKKRKLLNILKGSYVLVNFNSQNPFKFSIYKKGSQGLYFSTDNDNNLHFASDAYGLINKSSKFIKIIKDGELNVNKQFLSKFNQKKFHDSDLMTNDLSKKGFKKFFLKEFNDTEIFLKRTISNYISFNKNKFKNLDNIFDSSTISKLKRKKIKNIILTGMGSCYTAAVGISKYLNQKLYNIGYKGVKVEATIASEGSGFYLSDKMDDTIIIVLAQSGTTIDTNVFAKMAKERGAFTLALVNKKQGDVTFIVERSFYLGNGRDVEMSVPSTKTYTCHLLMGYILSEKIINLINNKKNIDFISRNKEVSETKWVSQKFNNINKIINKLNFNIFKFKNWFVLYDDSENSFAALEFRIKISECCYKSVPHIHTSNFDFKNCKKSLIFYLGTKSIKNKLINKSNYYISISKNKFNSKIKNSFDLILKEKDIIKLTVETALALQLIAYRLSEIIDNASKKIDNKNSKISINQFKDYILDKFSIEKFTKLSLNKKRKLLAEKLKRPIDAIKHQAKTVTVGATRSINIGNDLEKENLNLNIIKSNKVKFQNNLKDLKDNIHIIGDSKMDVYKYFIGNLVEYYNHTYKSNKHYKIYNSNFYDNFSQKNLSKIQLKNNNTIISNGIKKFSLSKSLDYDEIIKSFLPNDNISLKNEIYFLEAKKKMFENENDFNLNFKEIIKYFNNIKFLGSGINYLVAKKYALLFSNIYNKSIAFDVIENHKHIDISSESLVFIFASNINRSGFQNDVYSEVEKFIAHDNKPIIFTNIGNNIYDSLLVSENILKKRLIKIPKVDEIYSLSIFDFYFKNFIF